MGQGPMGRRLTGGRPVRASAVRERAKRRAAVAEAATAELALIVWRYQAPAAVFSGMENAPFAVAKENGETKGYGGGDSDLREQECNVHSERSTLPVVLPEFGRAEEEGISAMSFDDTPSCTFAGCLVDTFQPENMLLFFVGAKTGGFMDAR
jgi:hypothetical protein